MPVLLEVVFGVGQQAEIPGPFNGLGNASLLLARGAGAASSLDPAGGRQKPDQQIEALVVDVFELETRKTFSRKAGSVDDDLLLL